MKQFVNGIIAVTLLTLISCSVTKKVKDGTTAFQLKQYAVAVDLLEKEYKETDSKDVKAVKATYLGDAYSILQNQGKAVTWYQAAIKQQSNHNRRAKLAYAYKQNEQYQDAHDLFLGFYAEAYNAIWKQEMDLCKFAISQKTRIKNYNVSSFSANSQYNDYSPFYLDKDHLVFTSDRAASIGGETYKWTGNAFSDLFVANIKGRKVNNFDAILNSSANEGTACLSQDGEQIFFTRCESIDLRNQHCRIYFSHRPNGFWMEAEPLMFFDEQTNFAHPCLIENDSVLVFTASPAGGDGTYDLYYSQSVDGGWSAPEIMPPNINTSGNEKFPTSYKDTLFFASDKLAGFGGYDIFYSRLENGSWSNPQNLGLPVNSGADDFGIVIDPSIPSNRGIELQGYFSSSRNVGTGDDIFFFTKYEATEEEEEADETVVNANKVYNTYLSVRVVEIQYEDDDPNKKIVGKVPIKNAKVTMTSAEIENFKTDSKGRFTTQILQTETYNLLAEKADYISERKKIFTYLGNRLKKDTTINLEIALNKIIYDKEITLQSIYYDYERWDIRKDAKPSLDTLNTLLTLNPQLKIQLSSHTDCRGEVDYNINLSQKRAESAVNYLLESGIAPERMKAKGYGESKPMDTCNCDDCTEEQHQINRRTTFKIVKD